MERIPLTNLEPDFGIREAYASGDYEAWYATLVKKAEYHREYTSLIPERMLKKDEPITVDDVYAMLNVYFWWEEENIDPAECLVDLLEDLDFNRVQQAVRALHDAFPKYCFGEYGKTTACKKPDGWKCFTKNLKQFNKRPVDLKNDDLAEEVDAFFNSFHDEDYDSDLAIAIKHYNYRKLGHVGLSDIECSYVDQVLHLESDRREVRFSPFYAPFSEHIQKGGSVEGFLDTVMPRDLAKDDNRLKSIIEDYQDIPEDWPTWDSTKKFALAKRFVNENRDWYELLAVSYDWETYGVIPPYLYAMRPDGVFPGQI